MSAVPLHMLLTIYGVRWTTGAGFGAESRLAHKFALFPGCGYGVIKLRSLPQSADYPPRVRHEVNKPVVQSGAGVTSCTQVGHCIYTPQKKKTKKNNNNNNNNNKTKDMRHRQTGDWPARHCPLTQNPWPSWAMHLCCGCGLHRAQFAPSLNLRQSTKKEER